MSKLIGNQEFDGNVFIKGINGYTGNNPLSGVNDFTTFMNETPFNAGDGTNSAEQKGGNLTVFGTNAVVEGGSTNKATDMGITSASTDNEIITEWNENKFTLGKGGSSHAEGVNGLALGENSHAEGNSTQATGINSHAEGLETIASGPFASHAEGEATVASGEDSHAEGWLSKSTGKFTHAEGVATISDAVSSHAEGYGSTTKGGEDSIGAHAEGVHGYKVRLQRTGSKTYTNLTDGVTIRVGDRDVTSHGLVTNVNGTTITFNKDIFTGSPKNRVLTFSDSSNNDKSGAFKRAAHAEGECTFANGPASHAEGYFTKVDVATTNRTMTGAHAEGYETFAGEWASHSEGFNCQVNGMATENDLTPDGDYYNAQMGHAEGNATIAKGNAAHSEGRLTFAYGDNAHAEGDSCIAGDNAHAEGIETYAGFSTNGISVWGYDTEYPVGTQVLHNDGHTDSDYVYTAKRGDNLDIVPTDNPDYWRKEEGQHAEGIKTLASARASHAEGEETVASSEDSHAEGKSTQATGVNSHAEGLETVASGEDSHAEGKSTQAIGVNSHAEGLETIASGPFASHAEGEATVASGEDSHAEGWLSESTGKFTHAEGCDTTASGDYSHAEGVGGKSNSYGAHAEGIHGYKVKLKRTASKTYTNQSAGVTVNVGDIDTESHSKVTEVNGTTVKFSKDIFSSGTQNRVLTFNDNSLNTQSGAFNRAAHAEGECTFANGPASHAEGYFTRVDVATANRTMTGAHAEGYETFAGEWASHSEGFNCQVNGMATENDLTPDGDYYNAQMGHAEGNATIAKGNAAHSEGRLTFAYGDNAHAEGDSCIAGDNAHAEGIETYAGFSTNGISVWNTGITYGIGEQVLHNDGHTDSDYVYTSLQNDNVDKTPTDNPDYWRKEEGQHTEGIKTLASARASHAEGEYSGNEIVAIKEIFSDTIVAAATESTSYSSTTYTNVTEKYVIGAKLIKLNGVNVESSGITVTTAWTGAWFRVSEKLGIGNRGRADVEFAVYSISTEHGALGHGSHTEGIDTIARNIGEHAEGYNNASHYNEDSEFGNSGNTIHSVGIGGTGISKNAFEIMQNGLMFVYGVGGYDGTNIDTTSTGNSLQAVLKSIGITIDDTLFGW